MRKEKREVTETKIVTTYISEDGIPFKNEYECRDYEQRNLLRKAEDKIESLKIKNVLFPFSREDFGCITWYKLKSEEDFKDVLHYYNLWNSSNVTESDEPESYPAIVYVMESPDDYSYTSCMDNVDSVISDLRNAFEVLGYVIKFEKGE